MKNYTIQFQQQKPGSVKKVPVLTDGIEVGYGRIVRCPAVALGAPVANLWEVPFMKGSPPLVVNGQGRDLVYDCHPVPHREKPGRYLLAKSEHDSVRALVRIVTEAGEQSVPSGAVVVKEGNAVRVGYGHTANRKNAESVDILLDVYPGAKLVVTAGGTGGQLHQRYLLEYNGEGVQISPLAESLANAVVQQQVSAEAKPLKPVAQPTVGRPVYRKPLPVAALPDDLDAALEAAAKMSPEELADSAGGRMKGISVRRPDQMVTA